MALSCFSGTDTDATQLLTDSIYEEALATRESYCTSLVSAAFALKEVTGGGLGAAGGGGYQLQPPSPMQQQQHPASPARQQTQMPTYVPSPVQQPMQPAYAPSPTQQPKQMPAYQPASYGMQQQSPARPSPGPANFPHPSSPAHQSPRQFHPTDAPPLQPELPPGAEAARDRHALPKREGPSDATGAESKKTAEGPESRQSKEEKKAAPPSPDDGSFESADSALPMMLAHLVTLLLGMLWFAIKVPIRIGSAIFLFWALLIALRVAWFFLADDGGAWEMGAGVDWDRNMPGIF